MKIAIPVAKGKLCTHFRQCQTFALVEINEKIKSVVNAENLIPPAHEPNVLSQWLHQQGINVIIAGDIGVRTQQFFKELGIKVIMGANPGFPEKVAEEWIKGMLITSQNIYVH